MDNSQNGYSSVGKTGKIKKKSFANRQKDKQSQSDCDTALLENRFSVNSLPKSTIIA